MVGNEESKIKITQAKNCESQITCNSQFYFLKNTLDKSLLKLTVFCFILTKNRQILSALQFLLSCFIRISEKKFLAYFPYSRDFLSLRRMKERRKNRHLFIEGAPSGRQLLCKGACRCKNQRKAAESREGICKKYLRKNKNGELRLTVFCFSLFYSLVASAVASTASVVDSTASVAVSAVASAASVASAAPSISSAGFLCLWITKRLSG